MLTWLTAALVLTGFHANAQETACSTIRIYVEGTQVPGPALMVRAEEIAGSMFSTAGLQVIWSAATPAVTADSCGSPILIRFTAGLRYTPEPGALAYAAPFSSGVNKITVLWDQLRKVFDGGLAPADVALAHVLVHEITHILQVNTRHSPYGVMRAHWNTGDYREMRRAPLPFTSQDLALIHAGLNYRNAHVPPVSLAVSHTSPATPVTR